MQPSITVLNEGVPPFKESSDRKFETLLKAFFILAVQALQPTLAVSSVCQTVANWTRTMNNQHSPVFQNHAFTQQLPSAVLFCVKWNVPKPLSSVAASSSQNAERLLILTRL